MWMKTELEKVKSVCAHKPAWVCLSACVCGTERDSNKSITCRKYSFVSTKRTSEPEKNSSSKTVFLEKLSNFAYRILETS
jgi:hypothetical protein